MKDSPFHWFFLVFHIGGHTGDTDLHNSGNLVTFELS